ncbi:MAG: MoaD/ThiS family protein [Bacteroidetes bacterium]|nr:MoaD/ThiS family protein [Bacteroidota bacterium]
MGITILVFGQIKEITGIAAWQISGIKSTEELAAKLVMQFPELALMKYAMAVNKILIQTDTELNENDTVALLPPFSGG